MGVSRRQVLTGLAALGVLGDPAYRDHVPGNRGHDVPRIDVDGSHRTP